MVRLLFLAMACGCTAQPAEGRAGPDSGRPLLAFHQALQAADQGRGRVAVLQLGDSHTANDGFTGRLRELLQARFGDGGRGMMPPGIPHAWYRPARVSVTSEGWRIVRDVGPVGLAALRQHADGTATATIQAEPGDLARVTVEVLRQPGGGTLQLVAADGRSTVASTDGRGILRLDAPPEAGPWLQVVARGDGPVDLLSWTLAHGSGGATWSNLGTVGATMELTERWDRAILAAEAAALKPNLIVLAFGTNEGFKDTTDLQAYPALVASTLRRLRAMAPAASLVVVGPPAGVRRGPGIECPGTPYAVPPNLPVIRGMLKDAARAAGAFYWDWSAAMGGDCAMVDWARTDPPMAARDHVHLLVPGQRRTAEEFFAVLMKGTPAPPQLVGR